MAGAAPVEGAGCDGAGCKGIEREGGGVNG